MTERFIFGVPLIGRAAASDWALIDRLFDLTLRSVLAQTDGDFLLLLAGQDRPRCWARLTAGDPRFEFLQADFPAETPSAANDDGGVKKHMIKSRVRELGGGLLMFLDADDWIDRDLVRSARERIVPEALGALIKDGAALDFETMRALTLPAADICALPFHHLCGSCAIGRVEPASPDPVRHDPHLALGSHHEWEERARSGGHALALLDVAGVYIVGTGQNHSEAQGPFAEWRRSFTAAVRERGKPIGHQALARFGLTAGDLTDTGGFRSRASL